MNSPKYNRTMHFPFSPGASSDDKIAPYSEVEGLLNRMLVFTEKVDGSNTSLESEGCFARTHATAPTHASFDALKALHANIKHLIPANLQVFGEWCYALHSIPYDKLPGYFLAFNVRSLDTGTWEAWDMVKEWANELGVHTVPLVGWGKFSTISELQSMVETEAKKPSELGTIREGVVVRVAESFKDEDFSKSVMKWVRANHVQTTEHWKTQEIVKNKLKT